MKGKTSLTRKIAQLRRGLVEIEWQSLIKKADDLLSNGEIDQAEKAYLTFAKLSPDSLRAVDARWHAVSIREQELKDEDGAVALYVALEEEGDTRARKALERILEGRLNELENLRAQGKESEAKKLLEATKEVFGLRSEGDERLIFCRRELRRRQIEDEARQALEDGKPEYAFEVLMSYLEVYGSENTARRVRAKAMAVAWHELGDTSKVLNLLEAAPEEEISGPELRILISDMVNKTAGAVKDRVRYGYRVNAFREVTRLFRRLPETMMKERKVLHRVYLDELALGWTRMLQDRIREVAHGLMREKDRSSALWAMIQDKARGSKSSQSAKVAPENTNGDETDRLEKELEILRAIEQHLMRHEDQALKEMTPSRYRELSEDESGFECFQALLAETETILAGFEKYAEGFHVEWKDFLGSFLPGTVRDHVVDERYLDLVSKQDDLLSRVRGFLRERYGAQKQ